MQCTNHLKQAALALQNYHDVAGAFPASKCYLAGDRRYNAQTVILPYMEQNSLYEKIISEAPNHWDNHEANKIVVSTFLCPSDGNSKGESSVTKIAKMNLATCRSDVAWTTDQEGWNHRNAIRLIFAPLQWRDVACITDGTSNTVAFSELAVTAAAGSKAIKGGVVVLDATPQPIDCINLGRNPNIPNEYNTVEYPLQSESARGHYRGSEFILYSGFNTILPPNSPNCTGGDLWRDGVMSAQSYHAGGVNVARFDGSVAFVSETIDCGDLTAKTPGYDAYTGEDQATKSDYGVWGAMGTPAGGETISL